MVQQFQQIIDANRQQQIEWSNVSFCQQQNGTQLNAANATTGNFQTYPLKIIEMNDFFVNSADDEQIVRNDETLNSSSTRDYFPRGIRIIERHRKVGKIDDSLKASNLIDSSRFYANKNINPIQREIKKSSSHQQPYPLFNSCTSNQINILFIDSLKYREYFEKSHLKLKNNLIVLDHQVNLESAENARKLFDLLLSANKWLIHGSMAHESNANGLKSNSAFSATSFGFQKLSNEKPPSKCSLF